jgi:hypothetical protein
MTDKSYERLMKTLGYLEFAGLVMMGLAFVAALAIQLG